MPLVADARKLFVRALLLCEFPGMDPTSGMTETVFGDPGEVDELDPGELVGAAWKLSLCRLSFFCLSFQGGGGSAVEAWWQRRGRKLFVFLSKSATAALCLVRQARCLRFQFTG